MIGDDVPGRAPTSQVTAAMRATLAATSSTVADDARDVVRAGELELMSTSRASSAASGSSVGTSTRSWGRLSVLVMAGRVSPLREGAVSPFPCRQGRDALRRAARDSQAFTMKSAARRM
jgi:hypothetical protein